MYLYLIREKRQASEGPGRLLRDGVVPASQLLCPTWPLGVPTSSVSRSRVTVLRGSPGKPPQEAGRGVNLLAFCQDRGLRHCTHCRTTTPPRPWLASARVTGGPHPVGLGMLRQGIRQPTGCHAPARSGVLTLATDRVRPEHTGCASVSDRSPGEAEAAVSPRDNGGFSCAFLLSVLSLGPLS